MNKITGSCIRIDSEHAISWMTRRRTTLSMAGYVVLMFKRLSRALESRVIPVLLLVSISSSSSLRKRRPVPSNEIWRAHRCLMYEKSKLNSHQTAVSQEGTGEQHLFGFSVRPQAHFKSVQPVFVLVPTG